MKNSYDGIHWNEDAYVADVVLLEEQGQIVLGLADGRIIWRLLDKPETKLHEEKAHDGLTRLIKGFGDNEVFSIGEDGLLLRHEGFARHEIFKTEKAWLEQIAVYPDDELIAVSYKKNIALLNADGDVRAVFSDHPSAVTGLTFDPKGKKLVASHYNGVSIWYVNGEASQKPQRLVWKGSHLAVKFSPNGKYLLSVMQENALHGWRMPDNADFAMSGYAIKPKSFDWGRDGKWLATSGSPGIVCWDCSGKGPMGKPATVLGQQCPDITVKLAAHPELPLVAAGTENGAVYLAMFEDERVVWLNTERKDEITALAWSESGRHLFASCENGECLIWRFAN